jgi:Bacterial membrane protein YfhO
LSISRHEPGGRLALVVLICSAALLLPLAWPLCQGRVFVYNDLSWFHLPFRHLYQQALAKGDSLLWTPAIFSGVYFHGEGQTGVFHPLHLLLYRAFPLQAAFNLELLANYVAAFAGAWWFLHRLRFDLAPALFGAMLFAFGGFALLHHHHVNMIAVVAHLPWLLGAADVLIVEQGRPQRLAFAAVALILGSAFLIGFPQAVWWNAITLAAFAALRAGERGRWRALLILAAAVAFGVLLGGIQILPSADAVAHSDRAAATGEFALTYSLHPLNLLQLWSPLALTRGAHSVGDYMWFHEFGIYSGAVLPVGLAWVWTRRAALTDRRPLIIGATVFAALMLVLALGRYVGLAGLLVHLPVIGAMRAPARYVVLMQFALAILAVIAVEDLLAIREGRREMPAGRPVLPWLPTVLAVATTVGLNAGLLPYGRHTAATVAGAAPGVAIVATVTLLVILAARRVRWALPALVVVTAADLALYGIRFVYQEPAQSIPRLMVSVQPAPGRPEDSYAAAPDVGTYVKNLLVLRGYRLTTGYVGFFPAVRHPIGSEISKQLSGTRWRFTPEGFRRPALGGVERARLIDDRGQQVLGRVQLTADRPGRLAASVRASGPAILAFTERFHQGWTATAGGRPIEVVRVEYDFLGCRVDPGVEQVELRFAPRSFRNGVIVSAIGAVLLAGVLLVWRP